MLRMEWYLLPKIIDVLTMEMMGGRDVKEKLSTVSGISDISVICDGASQVVRSVAIKAARPGRSRGLKVHVRQRPDRLSIFVVDPLQETQSGKLPSGPNSYHPRKPGHSVALND